MLKDADNTSSPGDYVLLFILPQDYFYTQEKTLSKVGITNYDLIETLASTRQVSPHLAILFEWLYRASQPHIKHR